MDQETEVLEQWERAHPDAELLARVTSLAVRIDPSFLREARLQLLPGVPSDAEADLWFSPLVQSRSAAGFVLDPAISHRLRERLAQDNALLHRAWALRQHFHPYLTPEMRLEEEVSWLSLVEPDDERLNEALLRSVRAMNRGGERALEVARWALRAIPRLPERARRTKAGLALAFGTSEHLGFSPRLFQGVDEAPISPELLQAVRDTKSAHGTCRVGVRLRENALEFLEPPRDDEHSVLELPDTHPRLLELSWSAPQPGRKLLAAEPLTVRVPLPPGVRDLTLRSIQGAFRVTDSALAIEQQAKVSAGEPSAEREPPLADLFPSILRSTVERAEERDVHDLLLEDEKVIVVEAPDGYGKRTLVRRVHERLQAGPRRSFMATVRIKGFLVGTKGFSNNLAVDLPYTECAVRKWHRADIRSAIDEAIPSWKGEAGELLVEAILQAAPLAGRPPDSVAGWEPAASKVNQLLVQQYPELTDEMEALLENVSPEKTSQPRGAVARRLLTGRLLAAVQPRLREALNHVRSTRQDLLGRADELASTMRSKALALIEETGAAGLEQFLEQEFLPYFRGTLLLILIDDLDSGGVERADEFVRMLSGWALRSHRPWSCFHVVITATPGVARLPEAIYAPLAGLDAGRIQQLAQTRKLELGPDEATYLQQLTGGSVSLIDDALRAWPERQGVENESLSYELAWDDALRKRIKNYPDWLERFPEQLRTLGTAWRGAAGTPSALARLLDVGILEKTEKDYTIRAKLFEPLALFAREKTWPIEYEFDVYINAAPGESPDWLESFLTQLRERLERYLGRPLRVRVAPKYTEDEGPLDRSWVMVNIITRAFNNSKVCRERALAVAYKDEVLGARTCLYVRAENVPLHPLHEPVETNQLVELWELDLQKPIGVALGALRAANQLVPLMLHAPDAPELLHMDDGFDEELSVEEEDMFQLIETQIGIVEEAIRTSVPERLRHGDIHSDKLPSNDQAGTISAIGDVSFSLKRDSLELDGGGSATISAELQIDDVYLYVYIDKPTYWGMDEKTDSLFPLSNPDWNESVVETQPIVTLRATALLRIETEIPEDSIRTIIAVDVDEVTDIEIVSIHRRFREPPEPKK